MVNRTQTNKDKQGLTCDNCGKPGHTKVNCWKAGGGKAGQGPKQLKREGKKEHSGLAADQASEEEDYMDFAVRKESFSAMVVETAGEKTAEKTSEKTAGTKIPIELGEIDVWAIFDTGTCCTMADEPVWDRLEGAEKKTQRSKLLVEERLP